MSVKRSKKIDDVIEYTYKTKIKYMCPQRGLIEQEVDVRRYRGLNPPVGISLEIESIDSINK